MIGTGSQINNPGGQVTLQRNRADGLQVISRVTAKERPVNYLGTWNVISYAVCTNPLDGFSPQGSQAARVTGSEGEAIATVTCPPGTFVHGAAAATSNTESGLTSTPPGVAIQRILPFAVRRPDQRAGDQRNLRSLTNQGGSAGSNPVGAT